jgi:hypothetical protein
MESGFQERIDKAQQTNSRAPLNLVHLDAKELVLMTSGFIETLGRLFKRTTPPKEQPK